MTEVAIDLNEVVKQEHNNGGDLVELFPGKAEAKKAASAEEIAEWLGRLREKIKQEGPLLLTRTTKGTNGGDGIVDFVITGVADPSKEGESQPYYGVIEGTSYDLGDGTVANPTEGPYRNSQAGWRGGSTRFFWESMMADGTNKVIISNDTHFCITTSCMPSGTSESDPISIFTQTFVLK